MKREVFYGVGNLSFSIVANTISNFFMFFGTSVLGVKGALVGIAIAIGTIWNGIGDPIMGVVSDKFKIGKLGYRKGYMLIGAIGMALANFAVWYVPINASVGIKFIWMLVAIVVIQTFLVAYTTPYYALGVDISTGKNSMTRLMISKALFMFLGLVLPSVLITIFLPNTQEYGVGQLNPYGYQKIAVVVSTICVMTAIMCILFTPNKLMRNEVSRKFSLKNTAKKFFKIIKNKNMFRLILGSALADVSAVILTSVGMHFFTYCFYYTSGQITTILLTLLVGASVSQFLWYKMSKKSKIKTMLTSIFVTVIGVFCVLLVYVFRFNLNRYSFYLEIVSIFVCGFGSGALYTIPVSLYNDEVKIINAKTQEQQTATYTGIYTFSSSVLTALTQLITGVMLDLIHFDPSVVDQTISVQTGLALILFVGIMSVLILSYYLFGIFKPSKIK